MMKIACCGDGCTLHVKSKLMGESLVSETFAEKFTVALG